MLVHPFSQKQRVAISQPCVTNVDVPALDGHFFYSDLPSLAVDDDDKVALTG